MALKIKIKLQQIILWELQIFISILLGIQKFIQLKNNVNYLCQTWRIIKKPRQLRGKNLAFIRNNIISSQIILAIIAKAPIATIAVRKVQFQSAKVTRDKELGWDSWARKQSQYQIEIDYGSIWAKGGAFSWGDGD